jgi:hypothetical protein
MAGVVHWFIREIAADWLVVDCVPDIVLHPNDLSRAEPGATASLRQGRNISSATMDTRTLLSSTLGGTW